MNFLSDRNAHAYNSPKKYLSNSWFLLNFIVRQIDDMSKPIILLITSNDERSTDEVDQTKADM